MSARSRANPWWEHPDNFGRRCAEFADRRFRENDIAFTLGPVVSVPDDLQPKPLRPLNHETKEIDDD